MTRGRARRRSHPIGAAAAAVSAVGATLAALLATAPALALNDDLYSRQWGLHTIGVTAAWDAGIFGQGIDIAVVDTGVHLTHQDLAPNLHAGHNVVAPGTPPQDDQCDGEDCGHGTHVAGIAAAAIDNGGSVGVAPRARILPVKVLAEDGSGTTEGVAAGIRWAVANGAEVVNLSLGADLQGVTGPSDLVVAAVRDAWQHGVICVFAAGNSFLLGSGYGDEPAIVVSATDRRDAEPDYSSGVGQAKWGLAAPGGGNTLQLRADENIWSTAWDPSNATDRYTEKRGTSMAAPFVSGAAALLRSAGLSPQATVDRLLATAKDLGPSGKDSTYGAGRLDVARAVAGLSGASGTTGGGGGTGESGPATTAPSGGGGTGTPGGGGGGGGAGRTTTTRRPPPASPSDQTLPPPVTDSTVATGPADTDGDSLQAQSGDDDPPAGRGRDDASDGNDGGLAWWLVTLPLAVGGVAITALGAVKVARRRST